MFGSKKRKREQEINEAYEMGRHGTLEECQSWHEDLLLRESVSGPTEHNSNLSRAFHRGALAAFVDDKRVDALSVRYYAQPINLFEIAEASTDPAEGISRVLSILSDDKKQETLDKALFDAVAVNYYGPFHYDLVPTLLELGANPSAAVDEYDSGRLLARAIIYGAPLEIVLALYDKGARFEDALFVAKVNEYNQEAINQIEAYRDKIEGSEDVAAAPTGNIAQQLAELRAAVEELTVEVRSLKSNPPPAPAAEVPAAPEPAPAQEEKPVPAITGFRRPKP